MAAILACGEQAVLSHRSAAELWGLLPRARWEVERDAVPLVDVTVPGEGKSRPGIRVHRSSTLSSGDLTYRRGIRLTKPARTLGDLRRVLPAREFTAALRQAEFMRLPIGGRLQPDHTRSELEARFLRLVRRHRLPPPEVNVPVDRFVVDFLWRAEGLIAELDGWAAHGTRTSFERDRTRDNRLRVLGFQVIRFTWRQLTADPKEVAGTIRSLLTALW